MNEPKQRRFNKFAAVLFLSAASYGFLRSYVYRTPRVVHIASLQLRTLDGVPLSRNVTAGRPVVLNFWAPWCPPCREEMPWLNALQHSHPEIAVVGVEDDPDAVTQARALAGTLGITYSLAQSNEALRAALGRVPSLPTTLYINASGRVIHTVTGIVPESVMRVYLTETLASR